MVEAAVGDAYVKRVAEEVVDAVSTEDVAGDQVSENLFPGVKLSP